MRRRLLGPLAFGLTGVVFLFIAFTGTKLDTPFLVLGIVFLVLALGSYRRLRTPLSPDTDPRLPVSKTHQKYNR